MVRLPVACRQVGSDMLGHWLGLGVRLIDWVQVLGIVRAALDSEKSVQTRGQLPRLSDQVVIAQAENSLSLDGLEVGPEQVGVNASGKIGVWAGVAQRRRLRGLALGLAGQGGGKIFLLQAILPRPEIVGIGPLD